MSPKQISPQTRTPVSGEYPFLPFPLCSPKSGSRDPCSCSSLSARVWIKIFPPSLSGETCLHAHLHSSVFCFQKCIETIPDTPATAFFHLPSYLPFILYHLDIKNESLTLSLSKQITSTGHCRSARRKGPYSLQSVGVRVETLGLARCACCWVLLAHLWD